MSLSTRRGTSDPLVRTLLDKYKFNLLAVPRMGVDVCDFYYGSGRDIMPPDRLENVVTGDFQIEDKIVRGERFELPEVAFSNNIDVDVAAKLAGKLPTALGVPVDEAALTAALSSSGADKVRLRFKSVTRDSAPPLAIHSRLQSVTVHPDLAADISDKYLYLTVGVVRAKGLEFVASDKSRKQVHIEAKGKIAKAAGADAGAKVQVENSESGSLLFLGNDPIGFGVELVELTFDRVSGKLGIGGLPPAVNIRGDELVQPQFVGDDNGPIFVAI